MNSKTLVVLGGPTAVGKTSVAIQLAQKLNCDIVSADSRQVYSELNIGTAKPSDQELAAVPHHMINSHSVERPLSAGQYGESVRDLLPMLFDKSDFVILCGGSGLYINAVVDGIDEGPKIPESLRGEIRKNYLEHGLEWLQSEVKALDGEAEKELEWQNPRRLMRALEILKVSRKPLSQSFKSRATPLPYNALFFALEMDRPVLYDSINKRVDQMMSAGLLDEVRQLQHMSQLKAVRTVGYFELFDHLNGALTLDEAVDKIKQHTRNYAKRQFTWFRNDQRYLWIGVEGAVGEIAKALHN